MKFLFVSSIILLTAALTSCSPPNSQPPPKDHLVTIIDIGKSDRLELGRMIRIIKQHSPKIIGLDFFLVPDSLAKDSILVKELSTTPNIVQVVGLYSSSGLYNDFDSIKLNHPKFGVTKHGFDNLTTEDSIFIPEMPMQQSYGAEDIHAFSYVIAENSFGVNDEFKDHGYDEVPMRFHYYLGIRYDLITNRGLLSGNFKKDQIDGKIVLMGYMHGNENFYYTDLRRSMKIYGVEIHAALIEELIRRD